MHTHASCKIPKLMDLKENLMFDPWSKVVEELKCDIWLEIDSKNIEKWESHGVWTKWYAILDFRSTKDVPTCDFLLFYCIQRPNDEHLNTEWRKLDCTFNNLDNFLKIGWIWHGNKHMIHIWINFENMHQIWTSLNQMMLNETWHECDLRL